MSYCFQYCVLLECCLLTFPHICIWNACPFAWVAQKFQCRAQGHLWNKTFSKLEHNRAEKAAGDARIVHLDSFTDITIFPPGLPSQTMSSLCTRKYWRWGVTRENRPKWSLRYQCHLSKQQRTLLSISPRTASFRYQKTGLLKGFVFWCVKSYFTRIFSCFYHNILSGMVVLSKVHVMWSTIFS